MCVGAGFLSTPPSQLILQGENARQSYSVHVEDLAYVMQDAALGECWPSRIRADIRYIPHIQG
jgi:hypothetical protein